MARVIRPIASAVDVARRLVLESRGADPFVHLDPFLLETVDLVTPFLVGVHGTVLEHANAYLRKRRAGELTHFSLCRLRRNSIYAYAEDLAYFLNIYGEPSLALLRRRAKGGNFSPTMLNTLRLRIRNSALRPSPGACSLRENSLPT